MAEADGKPITGAQIKSIHAALARLGIEDGTYRELLRTEFGVGSCKDLSRRQASALLARLGRPLGQAPGGRPKRLRSVREGRCAVVRVVRVVLPPGVKRLASPAQRRFIAELAGEIAWREPEGFSRWLRRNQGIRRVATAEQASRVIEGLKALKRRGADGDGA